MARKVYTKENQVEKFGWTKTSEKVEITFNGRDGKSYDGETRKMNVWINEKHPDKKSSISARVALRAMMEASTRSMQCSSLRIT